MHSIRIYLYAWSKIHLDMSVTNMKFYVHTQQGTKNNSKAILRWFVFVKIVLLLWQIFAIDIQVQQVT